MLNRVECFLSTNSRRNEFVFSTSSDLRVNANSKYDDDGHEAVMMSDV